MTQPRGSSSKPSTGSIVAGIAIIIVGLITLIASYSVLQLPESVTEEGDRIKNLYGYTLAISMLVFFGVTAGFIWALVRFARKDPNEQPEQIHGSNILEFTWTMIPIIILVGLFIPSFLLVVDLKTPPADAETDLVVEAVGHQWWWEFIYPESGVRVQQTPPNYEDLDPPRLVVPVGQDIVIKVRSTDVIHSFYAINTLYKIQAVPGNVNEMHLKIEKAGTYHGQCYQFCGLRHSDMLFVLDARSEEDYNRWLDETRRAQGLSSPEEQAAAPVSITVSERSE